MTDGRHQIDDDRVARGDEVVSVPHVRSVAPYAWAVATLYLIVLGVLAARGIHVALVKTLLAPWLIALGIYLAGRRAFVREWAVPFGAVMLFDSARGWIYAAILAWHLPVHRLYVLEWERAVFGTVLPVAWQGGLRTVWLDSLCVIVHASHFVFFLLFGFAVWVQSPPAFRGWARGLYGVLALGTVTYLLVPTAPPWMIDLPLERVTATVYSARIPTLVAGLDTNPVAAMPSLHVGIPAYCAIIGAMLGGWRAGAPLTAYTGLVAFSAVYLGEHYGVDVLAGVLVAGVCAMPFRPRREVAAPYQLAGLLVGAAVGLSVWAAMLLKPST